MVKYGLGVDLGTTHTAAAVTAGGVVEAVRLGGRRSEIPSLVLLRDDGEVLVGEAAQRRGESEPTRLAREFKRRLGDPVPLLLGGTPMSAHALTARLLEHVVEVVTREQEAPPARIVLTHPANWGPYKRELLTQAAQLAHLSEVTLRPEPEAAAVRFAATARVAPGEIIAVYDLGGGTFDAAVLRKTAGGFDVVGEPQGVEQLGGIDFDEAILEHVRTALGDGLAGLDPGDEAVTAALTRLRRECVEAKESLSFDTEAEIPVALPQLHTRVQIRRSEFEALITPALADTVAALRRALRSAQVRPEQLRCIVLAGGSARIPLVNSLVATAFERPVVVDEQPELGIALGAARLSMPEGVSRSGGSGARLAPAAAGSVDTAVRVSGSAQLRPSAAVTGSLPPAPVSGIAPRPIGTETRPAEPAFGQVAVPEPGWADGTAQAAETGKADRVGRLRAYRWPAVAGIAFVLVAVTVTVATAWSRGSTSGGGSPGGSSAPAAKSAASLVWRVPTGQPATEPPAVTLDHVLLGGSDGTVRAFRRADGSPEWRQSVGPGVRVSTQITAGTAFATTTGGDVVALDVATGAQSWRRSTGTTFDARPIGGTRRVYAGGRDTVLYAYELGAGHRRWRVWTEARIVQPPALVGDIAVVAAGDRLYGVSQDGALLWKPSVGRATGSPVAAGDAACVPVQGGTVRCVRLADGQVLSQMTLPGAALAGGRGVVFAAVADGSVSAWDPHTGKLSWQYRLAGGPAEAGHPVLRAGEVDVAYPDGHLVGIDAATGAGRWSYRVDDRFAVAPGGDETGLVAVGETGILYALRTPGTVAISAHASPAVTPSPPAVTAQPTAAAPTHRRRTTYSSSSSATTESSPTGTSPPDTGYPTTTSVKPSY